MFVKTATQIACLALIAFLAGTGVYRAATESITADEAFTYNRFVATPLGVSLTTYDANHHVLNTYLCKISVALFGLSELTMRLPALAGALLFLVSLWRLARYALGRGWLCLLAVALAGLNPFVLDYLSAARGYSLALGFFFWGLFLLTRYLAEDYDPPERVLFRAGVAMGLAVAANLVFLVPAVGAGCAATALLVPRRAGVWKLVDRFWGPALVPAFLFWVLPLAHAEASNFYYGARSLQEMVHSLAVPSLLHDERVYRLGAGRWVDLAIRFLLPALALVILAGASAGAWRWFRRRDFRSPALLLLGFTMALSLGAAVAAHAWLGVLYPLGRTGIYWPPLVALASVCAAAWLWSLPLPGRVAGAIVAAALVLELVPFAAGFTTDQIPEWRYDAGTKRIVGVLAARHAAEPGRRVRLGATWLLEPSLNFYRQMYDLKWLAPVTRNSPDADYDYYVLLTQDAAIARSRGLRPLYTDRVSGATVLSRE